MGTTAYPSTDTPVAINLCAAPGTSSIVVTDVGVITDVTVDVDITSIDEGGGPDNSLLYVFLRYDSAFPVDVLLHDGTSDSLSGVNFDDDRSPVSGSMDDFYSLSSNETWILTAADGYSSCSGTPGSINSWTLNITVPDVPPMPPQVPSAPAARTIPTGIIYAFKRNGGLRRNSKLYFPYAGTSAQNIVDGARFIPFNALMSGVRVSAINTGSSGITQISLHKVSNGNDTVILNSSLRLGSGLSYSYVAFGDSFNRAIDKNDLVYFSLDDVAVDLQDITIELTLNLRD